MRDNDLDDLIIEDEETKSNNGLKNILTIIALIIIILIVAILLTKVIKNDDLAFEQTYNKTIDPELQLTKENNETEENIKSEPLSTLIDEESNTTQVKQETVQTTPTQKAEEKVQTTSQATPITPKAEEKAVPTSQTTVQTPVKVEEKVQETPKSEAKQERYYVQVGSYKTQPNETFLNIIKKSGYSYETKRINERTKLLIGPYNGREEASKALIHIKDRINKNAFLVQY